MTITARAPSVPWALAGLLACSSLGCAGEQEPLIVLRAVAPSDGDCTHEASNTSLTSGLYDVRSELGYVLAPVLRNNLLARTTSGSNTGVEDGELRLEPDVDITIHLPDAVDGLVPSDVPRSYSVAVATDSLAPDSETAMPIGVISEELIEALPAAVDPFDSSQARVDVVFHATRAGNSSKSVGVIDARTYSFPLSLCNGCLITSCECDAAGSCVEGTEDYAGTCEGQDPSGEVTFACLSDDPDADASTGSGEASTGPQEGSSGSSGA